MSAEHTPGPWTVLAEESDRDYVRVRGTRLGHRYKIANVLTVNYENGRPSEAEETQANARLIAAAPELLAELKEMVRMAENEGWTGFERAKAAIAKASPSTTADAGVVG